MNKLLLLLIGLSLQLAQASPVSAPPTLVTQRTCEVITTHHIYPCAVGKNGVRNDKQEGDQATPAGQFPIQAIFYRPDKLTHDEIAIVQKMGQRGFKVQALTPDDGWADDVNSTYYNQHIKISSFNGQQLPSHEKLWRDDDVYDLIAVIGYNDHPVVKGKGSAIFVHVARLVGPGQYGPTVGCVSLAKEDLLAIFKTIPPRSQINIPIDGNITLLP